MKYGKTVLRSFMVLCFIVTMTGCDKTSSYVNDINDALENSMKLKSAVISTEIAEGSYYPTDAPKSIQTEFKVNGKGKDAAARDINFKVDFAFKDSSRDKEVENVTNYEGLYSNIYYPFPKYNTIKAERVDNVVVNEKDGMTEYFVYYNGTHLSRREEWEYCKVSSDYEYFLIDEEGVILEYGSHTIFQREDQKESRWVDGESHLTVKLKEYTLL